MKKINICHVVYSFDSIGGLENGLINIVNGLDTNLFFHTICSLTKCGEIKARIENKNVNYVELHKSEGNDLKLPFKLSKIFKNKKIDIVHLRNWPTMVEGFIASKIAGIHKIIYSEHGRHFEEIENKQQIIYFIKKFIFNSVNVLLTISHEVAKEIHALYPLKREVKVIINGVDHKRFKKMSQKMLRKEYGFSNDDILLGTVGRLASGKNLSALIDSFYKHHSKREKLLIIGDGPKRCLLERKVAELNIGDRVLLMGNRSDIPQLLNCLNILILPSLSEGLSNVILEAMSCGLPIIAFDVGGNVEMIDHDKGGYLIELGENNALIESAIAFSKDKKKFGFGDYNRKKIETNFTIENMRNQYTEMYLNLFETK